MTDLPHQPGLTSAFGKDPATEQQLAALNDLLAPLEATLRREAPPAPQRPIVFILGAPRSGTTLCSQLLSASGGFATISNYAAKFWKAPALGLRMERTLGLGGAQDYRSVRGQTGGLSAPHEFGYFWSSWFDLGQDTHALDEALLDRVDKAGLQRTLAAMEAEVDAPLAFKNNTWFTFQAGWLARTFPTAIFVACRRDVRFVAQSLYEQRMALYGDPARWWSVRPARYRDLIDLPPLEQIAAQAVEIARDMEKALATVPPSRLISADYQTVCDRPREVLAEIAASCAKAAGQPGPTLNLEHVPRRFESTDQWRVPAETVQALERAVASRTRNE